MFRPRSLVLHVCVLLIFASNGFAEGLAHEALEKFSSRVEKHVLDNGIRVLMYRRGDAPVFAGTTSVRVGGTDEPPGLTGAAHLFEHMAFKGTPDVGSKNYSREKVVLERIEEFAEKTAGASQFSDAERAQWQELLAEAASLSNAKVFDDLYRVRGGSGLNATTDSEVTNYFVNLPRNSFEFWCWLESERIIRPVLREFYTERDVVMEERRMRYEDDPLGKLYENLLATAFSVHPYRRPVIGYADDIRRLTARRVDEFRRQYYVGSNIVVSLVGDVDPERDLPIIQRYFSRVPRGAPPPRPTQVEPAQKAEQKVIVEGHGDPQLLVAYKIVPYPAPDNVSFSLLSEVLAGGRTSPMIKELVREKRLATRVSYQEEPGYLYPNLGIFALSVAPGASTQKLLAAFDRIIRTVISSGITQEELDIARRSSLMDIVSSLDSNQGLSRFLSSAEILYGDWNLIVTFIEQLESLNAEDLRAVAKKYLTPAQRTVAEYRHAEKR